MEGPAVPREVGGYVLAGGQSRRMGRDKALLLLGGKPLVAYATAKLAEVCGEVAILSARLELARYGRLVPDAHPGCGPLGGMEAALLDTRFEWNLFLPVDVPFLPLAALAEWIHLLWEKAAPGGARVLLPSLDGQPQPTLALVHREMLPSLSRALETGTYKLMPVLAAGAGELAAGAGFAPQAGLWKLPYGSAAAVPAGDWPGKESLDSGAAFGHGGCAGWFLNLNTPEDFAEAVDDVGLPGL